MNRCSLALRLAGAGLQELGGAIAAQVVVFWISQVLVLWSLFGFGVSDFFVFVCFDCGSRIPRSGFGIL